MEKGEHHSQHMKGNFFSENSNQLLIGSVLLIVVLLAGSLMINKNNTPKQATSTIPPAATNNGSLQMNTFTLEDVQTDVNGANVKAVLSQRSAEADYVSQILKIHTNALQAWSQIQ